MDVRKNIGTVGVSAVLFILFLIIIGSVSAQIHLPDDNYHKKPAKGNIPPKESPRDEPKPPPPASEKIFRFLPAVECAGLLSYIPTSGISINTFEQYDSKVYPGVIAGIELFELRAPDELLNAGLILAGDWRRISLASKFNGVSGPVDLSNELTMDLRLDLPLSFISQKVSLLSLRGYYSPSFLNLYSFIDDGGISNDRITYSMSFGTGFRVKLLKYFAIETRYLRYKLKSVKDGSLLNSDIDYDADRFELVISLVNPWW
ncbi:MAG: hypothetical protein QG635_620 [Bacteroidota bacterium]|nr:hypothetical protein [Bacteroidota bacterium]